MNTSETLQQLEQLDQTLIKLLGDRLSLLATLETASAPENRPVTNPN